ncbi:MAG: hypothetical protein AAF266_15570, partial [Planctomycetota bacterium]
WKRLQGLRNDHAFAGSDDGYVKFHSDDGPYGAPPIFGSQYASPLARARTDQKDNVRWLMKRLDMLRGRQLLGFVRALDSHLNNTSLVLHLEFGNFRMLFPGDAEIASWRMITHPDGEADSDEAIDDMLRQVDLIKMSHHLSNNGTPRLSVWPKLVEDRSEDRPLHCLSSTQPTKFRGAIPNKALYTAMKEHEHVELLSTALPLDSIGALRQPAGWEKIRAAPAVKKLRKKGEQDDELVMGYRRVFEIGE